MLLKDSSGKILVSPNGKPLEVKDNFRSGDSESTSNSKPSASSKAEGDVFVYNAGGNYSSGSKAYVVRSSTTTTSGKPYTPLSLKKIAYLTRFDEDTIRQFMREVYEDIDVTQVKNYIEESSYRDPTDVITDMPNFSVTASVALDVNSDKMFKSFQDDIYVYSDDEGEIRIDGANIETDGKILLVTHGFFKRSVDGDGDYRETFDQTMEDDDPIMGMYIIPTEYSIESCNVTADLEAENVMFNTYVPTINLDPNVTPQPQINQFLLLHPGQNYGGASMNVERFSHERFSESLLGATEGYDIAQKMLNVLLGITPFFDNARLEDLLNEYGDFISELHSILADCEVALIPMPVKTPNGNKGRYFSLGFVTASETVTTKEWKD